MTQVETGVVLALACWRMSNLLANESGPHHTFRHVRQWAKRMCRRNAWCKRFGLAELVECEYCNSMWFATFITVGYLVLHSTFVWIMVPFALSTAAIIIKRAHEWLQK